MPESFVSFLPVQSDVKGFFVFNFISIEPNGKTVEENHPCTYAVGMWCGNGKIVVIITNKANGYLSYIVV